MRLTVQGRLEPTSDRRGNSKEIPLQASPTWRVRSAVELPSPLGLPDLPVSVATYAPDSISSRDTRRRETAAIDPTGGGSREASRVSSDRFPRPALDPNSCLRTVENGSENPGDERGPRTPGAP